MNPTKLVLGSMAILLIANQADADAPEVGFQAQIGIASAVERGGEVQKSELTFEPRMDVWFGDNVRLTGIGLVRADFTDKLEPGRSSNDARSSVSSRATFGDHVEFELRELFVDFELGEMQARVGKQQVVWGQADGLRILDVINPLSFREFILPDFEDRRIPLWMVNAEVPIGEATLQILWIPDQTYDEFPEPEGSFAFTSAKFRPVLGLEEIVRVDRARKPNSVVEDSDFGLRLSAFVGGWDLTANYLYHYQDQPVLGVDRSEAVTRITPTYERTHLIGGSASKAFGDFVFRSELGYSTSRYFSSVQSITGVAKTHEFSGVLGLDYSGLSDTLISGQFFVSAIDQGEGIVRDAREENLSLLIRRNFFNDTLTLEMLAIHNMDDSDGVVQLDVSYQFTSNTTLSAGADVFYGTADGLFGQFNERDRLSLRIVVSL